MTAIAGQAAGVLFELERLGLPERFKKAEIIGGNIIMSPLRSAHNLTMHRIMSQLDRQLPPDMLYTSDVLTPFELEQHEYCPDIAVVPRVQAEDNNVSVCDPAWIECVFEIISPTTGDFDYGVKPGIYARAAIAEYVIFDPYTRSASRFAEPEDGSYTLRQVVHYGKPVRIESPFPIVIETADLPVDPRD